MRIALVAVVGVVLAAVMATFASYGSLDPCDWLEQDQIENSSLPPFLVRLGIEGAFLAEGVFDPAPTDCLLKWWKWRGEALPEQG